MPPDQQTNSILTDPGIRPAGQHGAESNDVSADGDLIRILVLDQDPKTIEQIENALWVWPHRISSAHNVENAITMCQHLEPAAVIASCDFPRSKHGDVISTLRGGLPEVPIIAVGTTADTLYPSAILKSGADIVLAREELQRPTLHALLLRLRPAPELRPSNETAPAVSMPLPWRESQIVGSLICDIEGTIKSANACLSDWLKYSSPAELVSKCVWRDVLDSRQNWVPWTAVAGDMTALLHQSVSIRASNDQLLWMKVQVFAAPNSPIDLQAVFVDQTELAHLTGRFRSLRDEVTGPT